MVQRNLPANVPLPSSANRRLRSGSCALCGSDRFDIAQMRKRPERTRSAHVLARRMCLPALDLEEPRAAINHMRLTGDETAGIRGKVDDGTREIFSLEIPGD